MTKFEMYRRYMQLTAESAGLEWNKDGLRIRHIAAEQERLRDVLALPRFGDKSAFELSGLYSGGEDLCLVWTPGEPEPFEFARLALEFLVLELANFTNFSIHTLIGFANALGPELVDMLFDAVAGGLTGLTCETRRWESTEYDEAAEAETAIFARADEMDERFEEAPLCRCDSDADCATMVTIMPIDIEGLAEVIEARDADARRTLRGEAPRA